MRSRDIRRMVMSRRRFLAGAALLCTAAAVPMRGKIARTTDSATVRASRGRRYPGPLRRLHNARITQIAPWAG